MHLYKLIINLMIHSVLLIAHSPLYPTKVVVELYPASADSPNALNFPATPANILLTPCVIFDHVLELTQKSIQYVLLFQ